MPTQITKGDIREYFEMMHIPEPMSGCWLWLGPTNNKTGQSYASFRKRDEIRSEFGRRMVPVAWFSLVLHGTPRPPGAWGCHKCDTPQCVNPEHLYWGTPTTNNRDTVKRKRGKFGETHPNAKLTEEDVRVVRCYHSVGVRARHLSRIFGVWDNAIRQILSRRTWPHVP